MNIVFSKSELKAKLTRDQLKAYRHRQKVSRRETLFQQVCARARLCCRAHTVASASRAPTRAACRATRACHPQAEQLIRTSGDRDMRVSRRAAEELINEHKASRTLRLHRISSAISGAKQRGCARSPAARALAHPARPPAPSSAQLCARLTRLLTTSLASS
jgi:hypothetical protein